MDLDFNQDDIDFRNEIVELFEKYKWDVISRLKIEEEASTLAYKRFEDLG